MRPLRSGAGGGHHGRHRSLSTSFSIPSVSSTASVIDEDETMVDPEALFKAGRAVADRKPLDPAATLPTPLPTPQSTPGRERELEPKRRVFSLPAPLEQPLASTSELTPAEKAATDVPEGPRARSPARSTGSRLVSAVGALFGSASNAVVPVKEAHETSLEHYACTASALFTGLFLGTFITLCVLSPHRREIANHFT